MKEGRDYEDLALVRRIFGESRGYRWHIAGIFVMSLLATPLALLSPVPLKIAIDSVLGSEPVPGFIAPVMPDWFGASELRLLVFVAVLQVAIVLFGAVLGINERQPGEVISLLERDLGSLEGSRIAVLGLAFKPGTDDMRESPAIPIVSELRRRGATVGAYDPGAGDAAARILGNESIDYLSDLEAAIGGADAVVVVTPWPEFDRLPAVIAAMASQPLVVDGRRAFNKHDFSRYTGIGL